VNEVEELYHGNHSNKLRNKEQQEGNNEDYDGKALNFI